MLIIDRIATMHFSPTEEKILAYMEEQGVALENCSLKIAAAACYTQPSTFVRLAKKFEFKGWPAFKKQYLKELQYLTPTTLTIDANLPFTANDSQGQIAQRIAQLTQQSVHDTLEFFDYEVLHQVVQWLRKTPEIKLFSTNANRLMAQEFVLRMNRLQKPTSHTLFVGEERFEAANLQPGAVAIVISYSGENDHILALTDILKQRKIYVVALTSFGGNTLSEQADAVFYLSSRERLYRKISNFTVNVSISYLLNVLYSCYFAEDYQYNLDHLVALSEMLDNRTSKNSAIREQNDQIEQ